MTNVSPEAKTSQSLQGESLVIVKKTFESDKTILSINMDNLSAEPDFVVKKVNGDSITIPGEIAKLISTHGYEMFNEYEKRKTNLRFLENHPTKLDSDIIEVIKGFNDKLVVRKTSTEDDFWPAILSWYSESFMNPYKSSDSSNIWEGWILNIEKSQVGKAEWKDIEGIKNLIEAMKDENKLKLTLALLDPIESSMIASRLRLLELYRNRQLPITTIPDVYQILIDNEFIKAKPLTRLSRVNYPGKLRNFNIMIGEIKIPIAVGIDLPISVQRMASFKEEQEKYNIAKLEKLQKKDSLSQLMNSLSDWYLVDSDASFIMGMPDILITRISPDIWRGNNLTVLNQSWVFNEEEVVKI